MVGLSWVRVHVGIPGNELTDQQAKLASTSGEELFIPAPYFHLKCPLKNYIVKKWNEYWNSYDSALGIRVRGYTGDATRAIWVFPMMPLALLLLCTCCVVLCLVLRLAPFNVLCRGT
ncbi:hypothetical protein AVEN_143302-1 [Araneus ventricosus]|uniref:RNase H type-1 domain-containing protein n=1 Tax=Araneus ventricosus TaxID=182803 RepID=A0A4Y2AE49_ARAVE|nr:hypothetical protein AVEN_143302-1 [Araneus ventricosus]